MAEFQRIESISSKFIHAISWTTLASIIGRASGFITAILFARFLGSNLLGIYTIILATLGLFNTLIASGLGLTASKMVAQYYIKEQDVAGKIIGLLLIALTVMICLGVCAYWCSISYISNVIYKMPELSGLLRLSLIWLILMCVNNFVELILAGMQSFKSLMIITSIMSMLNLPLILIALLMSNPQLLFGLVIASTISAMIQFFLLFFQVLAEIKKYAINISFNEIGALARPVLFDFGAPAYIGKLMEQPLSWVSILILTIFGGGPSSVGGLTIINNLRAWVLYLPALITVFFVPLFTDIYHTREIKIFRRVLELNQRLLWVITFPLITVIILMVHPLILLCFGQSYEKFWFSGVILLAGTILIPLNEVNDKAMVAMNKMWLSLLFRIIYLILFLSGLLTLVPKYNLNGYVISWVFSYFIYVLIQTFWLSTVIKERADKFFILFLSSIFVLFLSIMIAKYCPANCTIFFGITAFMVIIIIEWLLFITNEEKQLLLNNFKQIFKHQIKF
ncbi:MAG: hypothetical protein A3B68_07915 [Candidatus Melainabacteria bacterium RIFCSPHIGHO2_02_FULL_34_12]|nr:MAG: hypothetical protein A3B68_07915 [Candidatus Melainabacteria bacterium RIFCSPHIGHO2_02_FULL_34_12]